MITWSRLAMLRSGSRISAIFASTTSSPSPLPALISWTRSLIAPRSSSLNALPVEVLLLADFCVPFCAGFMEFDSSFSELKYFFASSFLAFQSASNQLRRTLIVGTAATVKASTLHGTQQRHCCDRFLVLHEEADYSLPSISCLRNLTSCFNKLTGTFVPRGNCSVALAALYCSSFLSRATGRRRGTA